MRPESQPRAQEQPSSTLGHSGGQGCVRMTRMPGTGLGTGLRGLARVGRPMPRRCRPRAPVRPSRAHGGPLRRWRSPQRALPSSTRSRPRRVQPHRCAPPWRRSRGGSSRPPPPPVRRAGCGAAARRGGRWHRQARQTPTRGGRAERPTPRESRACACLRKPSSASSSSDLPNPRASSTRKCRRPLHYHEQQSSTGLLPREGAAGREAWAEAARRKGVAEARTWPSKTARTGTACASLEAEVTACTPLRSAAAWAAGAAARTHEARARAPEGVLFRPRLLCCSH